ncbi:MAG: hypothetical protein R3D55_17900 [Chloroflexota bacterium]
MDIVRDYDQILEACTGTLGMFGSCHQLALSAAEIAELHSRGLTVQQYAVYMLALVALAQIVFLILGLLILWRQGVNRLGLMVSLALIVIPYAMYTSGEEFGSIHPALFVPGVIAGFISPAIMASFLYLIPNGRFSPRWAYIPLICTLLLLIPSQLMEIGFNVPTWINALANPALVGLVVLGIGLQIYRYAKEANSVEQQQTKWVIFGVVVLASTILIWVPVYGGVLDIPGGEPRLLANVATWTLIYLGHYFLPIAITIAILRYKLWGIDVIIRRTLLYLLLSGSLVLVYFGMVILLQGAFRTVSEQQSPFVIVISTLVIAALFNPLRTRLQAFIDRRFYRQKVDAQQILAQFAQTARDEVEIDTLQAELVQVVQETMQPAQISVWIKPVTRLS